MQLGPAHPPSLTIIPSPSDSRCESSDQYCYNKMSASSSQREVLIPKTSNSKEHLLLTWKEVEPWQRDNAYILGNYRAASKSLQASFASWLYLHNESVNIHTHLGGAVTTVFISIALFLAGISSYETTTSGDILVFAIFLLAALTCLSLSTMYHTVCDHSRQAYVYWQFADFMGILALITGSFYPGVYYGFYCEPGFIYLYWFMVRCSNVVVKCSA